MPFAKGHKINVGRKWPEYRKLEYKKVMKVVMANDDIRSKISKTKKGVKFSDQHRINLSISHLGQKGYWTGKKRHGWWQKKEKHPNWRGGSSFEPYPLGWTNTFKEQIRYRDGYRCQLCGCSELENSRKLDIHHIDYNKENLEIDNLITVCRSCHGKTNINRKYWEAYFKNRGDAKLLSQELH